jgi:DNA-binding MarR family transcriptional regulator
MARPRLPDAVDAILTQWQRERPDLDVSPMGPIGRLKRCAALLQRRLDATFDEFGLSFWEFDMLATLRRSGAPYCLAPTTLFSTLMVTSGTMTHRMGKLEASGWIERLPNPDDARSSLVQLTPAGLALIDRILAPLKASELAALDTHLARLLATLEPIADGNS